MLQQAFAKICRLVVSVYSNREVILLELENARDLINKYLSFHANFVANALRAQRYYIGDNYIKHRKNKKELQEGNPNPLRNADNRIAFNFHGLLVNQKASYIFTAPPIFDVKDDLINSFIADTLGDAYAKKAKDLCVEASNTGVGWAHYWISKENKFKWAVVPSIQIYPIYSNMLEKELKAVLRIYKSVDDEGKEWDICELWNEKECAVFKQRGEIFEPYNIFTTAGISNKTPTNIYNHGFDEVPFIEFPNNNTLTNDFNMIKDLIDAYDKTYSGFVDDLEDIQEIIFVLNNYGGQDLNEFLSDLKYYKAIKTESDDSTDKSGISTLTIEIPVEARDKLLELTRKAIFDMGQGIDPQQQGFDRTSGEAMKFLYSLLELKAGLLETEFRLGFGKLIRAICKHKGFEPKQIIQTWTRTSIRNDAELVDMCSKSVGVLSNKTILKNHPFVENAEDEEKQLQEEQKQKQDLEDIYGKAFNGGDNIGDTE